MSFDPGDDDAEAGGGTPGEHDGGAWPAFADLFAATSLVMLLFFAVLAAGFVKTAQTGTRVNELTTRLRALSQQQQTFTVQPVGVDVLIVLEENVTFPRNHSSLDSLRVQGRSTLRAIAEITTRPEFSGLIREIEVVGHADRTQYRRGTGLTNWGISAARAATVAQFMVDSARLDPCQIIPSGRGEYYPRDSTLTTRSNATDALDRRIEILLHPVVQGSAAPRRGGCRQ